ncbi:hypothetical protein A1O1_06271 [Capronia coronata CBS 617.96]|uniref:VPS9 domain-containing protein n=1 Tax=Capronia coronata CBS 617.96 TaxID=1182541 RepID=W9XZF1_9EURO|nr:uncharacterized protein A1O1_06271 [Capronia coronata CBS 617.96]EXJ85902.1 hypothetical protein A1O1_06271 [Capronia coronata CBS 617.96]
MPVLNPFLRALFQSSVLGSALAAQNYVLLVPTTESLLYGQDRDTHKRFAEQVEDEDFLGSHLLRILPSVAGKEGNVRDNRNKAKTYATVNGRSVILKENVVYTNKGFKQLTQATLLTDLLYYSPGHDMQQWLVYYISKPLTGLFEPVPFKPAIFGETKALPPALASSSEPPTPKKKDVKTFSELLNSFPMIGRQMQPGLERLFNEFGKELGRPLPPPPSRSSANGSLDGTTQASENDSIKSNGSLKLPFNSAAYFEDEEDLMRRALETAVTAAIDLFQGVDKQQLSYLGATTDLTGPDVERLIERYVAEYVHDSLLFPRLCAFYKVQDQELDRRIRQMDCLDVSQVGIAIEDGRAGKRELMGRISRGVAAFRRMGVASSPQEMLDILLETQKIVSEPQGISDVEKRAVAMTINADVLVSLILLVVIRSSVRHLQARLSYMQRFIYIDDVESGEIGYALSTLEAVLTYLARDAAGLRKASKQNQLLWNAVKAGKIDDVRSVFEESAILSDGFVDEPVDEPAEVPLSRITTSSSCLSEPRPHSSLSRTSSNEGGLSHVFPFQAAEKRPSIPRLKKKVQMAARSLSISSSFSLASRAATIDTTLSGLEGDTSVRSLAQTQDAMGNSILMMAIESQQPQSLRYLLSLSEHYSPDEVLSDVTQDGTSLLSAAVQLANTELVDIILQYAEQNADEARFRSYLALTDSRGRSVAHYLFNAPELIKRLANVLPWRQKDKIGHTPLFAICRTYDHPDYSSMVSEALIAAKQAQNDDGPLRIEEHTDHKGNSLLHIVNDAGIMQRILQYCDVDLNAMNDRKFTPLMLASKYGRVDMVRIFLGDPRIDLHLREARGLTAVELAKDDEVRNRIDDLTLFAPANTADMAGRITSIVRSFFVEDGSSRYILKSGAPNPAVSSTTYTITTSRRSLQDFENLAKWLLMDSPASYMPTISTSNFRSPFQLHSRPSRAVLYDAQTYLDRFLKMLINHPTFSTHEMLWEFFLVPDMLQEQMAERAKLKSELVQEKIMDEYEPLTSRADMNTVETVVTHSREMVRRLNISTRSVVRRGHVYVQAHADLAEAMSLCAVALASLGPPATTLSQKHVDTLVKFASLMHTEPASSPLANFVLSFSSLHATIAAVQSALLKPSTLVGQIYSTQRALDKYKSNLANNATPRKGIMNINFPGTEENRAKTAKDTEKKIVQAGLDIERLGKELRYTQEVVVGELAGWTTWREEWGRDEIKRLARNVVVKERERLKCMQRALRALKEV